MLGGTGSMNVMIHMRGSRHDYDKWERHGCTSSGYKAVLPFFKKMKTVQIPEIKNSRVLRYFCLYFHGVWHHVSLNTVYLTFSCTFDLISRSMKYGHYPNSNYVVKQMKYKKTYYEELM